MSTYASSQGAKAWGIYSDISDLASTIRSFEDCGAGPASGHSVSTTSPPTGHTRWISSVPTNSAQFFYDGNSVDGLPLSAPGENLFAVCAHYVRFSALPSSNVNCFLQGLALGSNGNYIQRRIRLITTGAIQIMRGDELAADTTVETFAAVTNYAFVMKIDTNYAGTIRTKLYYSTDGGATFTACTWNVPGTATGSTSTTLTDSSRTGIWETNQFVGRVVTMDGKTGTITSNTDTVLTVDAWAGGTPTAGAYTMNAVDYHDRLAAGVPEAAGAISTCGIRLGSPVTNDNGMTTFWAEVGVVLGSAWLGDVPLNFTVGEMDPTSDSADANYLEWTPVAPVAHYTTVNTENGPSNYVETTVAGEQEVFGYANTDTTILPTGNTPLALKHFINMRASASLPDATNLKHLIFDGTTYHSYDSLDVNYSFTAYGTQLTSSVSLVNQPGSSSRITAAWIDAVEAGLDKVGDDTLNYRCRQSWLTVLSISNPRSPDLLHPTLMGMSPAII